MNIKTTLKTSVAAAALFAIAAPVTTPASAADDTLKSGNKNSLTVSGYVARSLMYADDGEQSHLFITDGSTSETRVRWVASGTLNENVTAGAMIEMEVPLSNSQSNASLGDNGESNGDRSDMEIRQQYVWVSHKKFGKISLGHTDEAANGTSEASLTGTTAIDLSSAKPFCGSCTFLDATNATASRSAVTVGSVFDNFDGGSRDDVIKYQTPSFQGLSVAVSLDGGGSGAVGGFYSGKFGGVQVLLKAGYTERSSTSTTVDERVGVSGAALHSSGLNIALAYAYDDLQAAGTTQDPRMFWGALGYRAKIFAVGGTNFAFTYQKTKDQAADSDEAEHLGVTILQNFDAIGANVGFKYVNYSLDRPGQTYDDIDVIALQTVFNF